MNSCALCGRVTLNPAVLIGNHPVGPKCAKKAGLIQFSKRKSGLVFPVAESRRIQKRDNETLDLFAEA